MYILFVVGGMSRVIFIHCVKGLVLVVQFVSQHIAICSCIYGARGCF